jgi:predicted amidohydrolase YtcJ
LKVVVEADRIYTMNQKSPFARFLVAEDGFITYVGEDSATSESRDSQYFDFTGNIITPGLIDSHNHFFLTGLGSLFSVDLSAFTEISLEEVNERIRSFAKKTDFPWILGSGLNERRMIERRMPTIKDLDGISTKPIYITHNTVHYGICNSAALRIAQITRETSDPVGAKLGRFPDGEPNGILYEPAAMDLVRKHIPPFSTEQYERAVRSLAGQYLAEGLVCVKDTGGTGSDLDEARRVQVLNKLDSSGQLQIRQSVCLPVFSLEDASRKLELSKRIGTSEFLSFVGFKLFLDGSGYGRTAWMKKEWNRDFYTTDKGNFGFPLWKIEEFRKVLEYLGDHMEEGIIDIHTIGDQAIETALTEIARIKAINPKLKFSLIHVYSPDDRQLELMKQLDILVEFQSPFLYFYGDLMADNLGRERLERFMRAKSFLNQGIVAANSSDSPVVPFAPVYGIYSSMFRETRSGSPDAQLFNPDETVSFEEALALYTRSSAKCAGRKDLGTLEKGKRADFVVWNKTLEDLRGKQQLEGNVLATFVGGRKVFARETSF